VRLHPANPDTQIDDTFAQLLYPVTLENPRPGVTARVDWAVSQGQHPNFQNPTGTITFNPGERRKVIALVVQSVNLDGRQPFTLTIRNPQPNSGADRTRIAAATAAGAIVETDTTAKQHNYRIAYAQAQVNEGSATRVDMTVFSRNVAAAFRTPTVDVSYTLCIVHNVAQSIRTRYSLGNLAAADDIRVTPTAQNPNGIGPVRQGSCNGVFAGSTLVDVRIPRNSMRFSEAPSFTTSFLVHSVADAAAEGAETIWIVAFRNLFGQAGNLFSQEQLAGEVFDARGFAFSSAPANPDIAATPPSTATPPPPALFRSTAPPTATEASGALQYTVSLSGSALGHCAQRQLAGGGQRQFSGAGGGFSGALSGSLTFPVGTTTAQISRSRPIVDRLGERTGAASSP